ncbi:hypothetical protein FBF48_10430 [Streptococcus salivarius]|uniref:TetR family transcriptional regulator n=1 Tax=Streptococcus salivarius TaxID=1304 RepID=A0AAX2UZW6_STRSL|nr:hypothetical protein [Streptococcus salivarius]TNF65640.1 hypothetical protein FBF48_10430 [Streptococcus salivarius]
MTTPNTTFNRLNPEDRKARILKAGVELAQKSGGLMTLQRLHVAHRAQCSPNLVNHYLGSRDDMIAAIIKEGIRLGNLDIIGQAVIAGHKAAKRLTADIKQKAISHTAGI